MMHADPPFVGPNTGLSGDSDILDDTMVAGSGAPQAQTRYSPGTAVGRYVILEKVGAGGMGVVYAAFDPQLNRKIALKLLDPKRKFRSPRRDQAAVRFMREAQAIARLSHPNVVNVYDVGRHGDAVFMAMEFVEGMTLTHWLELGARSVVDICRVFARAGRGLAAAHDAGLVHRDFKPDNVLVSSDGRVRVLDFGLARADPGHISNVSDILNIGGVSNESDDDVESVGSSRGIPQFLEFEDSDVLSSPLTLEDAVVGTPRYMAPEQHAGVGVDARSDQFSFCVALYQALYRQEPFPGERLYDLVGLKQQGVISVPPATSSVPAWLEELIMRGLEPNPAARWPSMHVAVSALEHDRGARRRRWLAAGSGAIVFAAATISLGHRLGRDERPCQASQSHLDGVWDAPQQDAVRDAILSTDLPYSKHTWPEIEWRLDDQIARWAAMHQNTCEATHVRKEQSAELLDIRMSCLQDHLSEIRVVIEILAEPDPMVVQRAVDMVSRLPELGRCNDTPRLLARLPPPTDEATRVQVESLRQLMRQARTRKLVQRGSEAQALAQQALRDAEALGYEPLRVEALVNLGIVLEYSGDFAPSESHLREALTVSLSIGHDEMAYKAATQLVSVVGDRLARFEEGLLWAELAEALLDRTDTDGMARVNLANNKGNVLHRKGKNAEALLLFEGAVARREALSTTDDPAVALERVNLGNAQLALGRYESALDNYVRAEASMREVLGTGHPQIAMATASIGIVYHETGRNEQALVQHRAALTSFERWLGSEHHFIANTLSNIGVALQELKQWDEAFDHFERAQKIFERSLGPEHPQVALGLYHQGSVRADQGRYEAAGLLYERALELRRLRFEPAHPTVVAIRLAQAELLRLRGKPGLSIERLEALVPLVEGIADDDGLLVAQFYFVLAKARWDAEQGQHRVGSELNRVRTQLDDLGPMGGMLAREVHTWAAEHAVDDEVADPNAQIVSDTDATPSLSAK